MIKKMQIIENLSDEQVKQLIAHFNTVYECTELNEMEENTINLEMTYSIFEINKIIDIMKLKSNE